MLRTLAKRALPLVGIAFVVYYIVTQPTEAARAAEGIGGWFFGEALPAIGTFITAMFNG